MNTEDTCQHEELKTGSKLSKNGLSFHTYFTRFIMSYHYLEFSFKMTTNVKSGEMFTIGSFGSELKPRDHGFPSLLPHAIDELRDQTSERSDRRDSSWIDRKLACTSSGIHNVLYSHCRKEQFRSRLPLVVHTLTTSHQRFKRCSLAFPLHNRPPSSKATDV